MSRSPVDPATPATPAVKQWRLVVALAPVLVAVALGWHVRWIADDGYINLRIVDQIWHGNGPVFNAGERVETATSPLWLWLLVIGRCFGWLLPEQMFTVLLGLGCGAVGMVLALLTGRRLYAPATLRRDAGPVPVLLPTGLLVLAALPPFRDFLTSGLETGLTFLWIGGCGYGLARRLDHDAAPLSRSPWVCVWIGLGPLIRPDLALYAGVYGLVLLVISRPSRRSTAAALGYAAALPVAYEIFRAGYYATLVPNTALAKSAATSNWSQGWRYLDDFAGRYWLIVPLVAMLVVAAPMLRHGGRRRQVIVAGSVAVAALHVGYIVRLGGDFMHGRFLLPATFAVCVVAPVVAVGNRTPAFSYPARTRGLGLLMIGCAAVVAVWSVLVGAWVRPPNLDQANFGIVDERGYWRRSLVGGDSLTLTSWRNLPGYRSALAYRAAADQGRNVYFPFQQERPVPSRLPGVYATHGNLGMVSLVAGRRVFLDDSNGLADPFNARTTTFERARPGHQFYPETWRTARFAATSVTSQEIVWIRAALRCGDLAELDAATTAPLTPGRFLRNMTLAPRLTTVKIPASGATALFKFCYPRR